MVQWLWISQSVTQSAVIDSSVVQLLSSTDDCPMIEC